MPCISYRLLRQAIEILQDEYDRYRMSACLLSTGQVDPRLPQAEIIRAELEHRQQLLQELREGELPAVPQTDTGSLLRAGLCWWSGPGTIPRTSVRKLIFCTDTAQRLVAINKAWQIGFPSGWHERFEYGDYGSGDPIASEQPTSRESSL